MHPARPLAVGGIHERLAEAHGAAIVHADRGVPAVGHELVHGIVAPTVPRPRAAMDVENRRQRFGRPVPAVPGRAHGKAVVGHDVELIARPHDRAVHGRQDFLFQFGPVAEQVLQAPRVPVVQVVRLRAVGPVVGDDPPPIVQRSGDRVELAPVAVREPPEVGGDRLVQHRPCDALMLERHGLRPVGNRMADHVGGVRVLVRGQRRHGAGLRVQGDQRRRIPAAAVAQVQESAGRIEMERTGGHVVLGADRHERLPLPGPGSRQDLHAPIRWNHGGEPSVEGVVGHESIGSEVILDDELRLSCHDVDAIEIVVLRVPPVDPDEHLVRDPFRQAVRNRLDPVVRREVARPATLGLDGMDVPVFVPVPVLPVEEVAGMVAPEVVPDAPAAVAGDRLRIPGRVQRRHPDVEHPVQRCQVGDPRAVVAQRDRGAFGVSEQRLSGDQVNPVVLHFTLLPSLGPTDRPVGRCPTHSLDRDKMMTLEGPGDLARLVPRQWCPAPYLRLQGLDVDARLTRKRRHVENPRQIRQPIDGQHDIRVEVIQNRFTSIESLFQVLAIGCIHTDPSFHGSAPKLNTRTSVNRIPSRPSGQSMSIGR